MRKMMMTRGLNVAEARRAEGDKHKGFKRPGPGAVTLRPSGKGRKNIMKKGA